ncbi:MAG: hypothetical protein FJW23_14255 [Acidimicrobiia bacterium]|nr:hypothetical protein [Acidimicrobiia bacterium]
MNVLELSRYLFLLGALPFIVLGVAHAVVTPQTPADKKGLSPRDPAVRDAMARDTILLTGRTTLWLTWVGFSSQVSAGQAPARPASAKSRSGRSLCMVRLAPR